MVSAEREVVVVGRLHKHVCLSEDSYVELGLFFHLYVGSRDWIRIARFMQ